MSKITIIYDDGFSVTTYEKELPNEGIEDVFEAYLEANERFTFVNAVSVTIHNPVFESTVLEWDCDNGLSAKLGTEMKPAEEIDEPFSGLRHMR
jgi:phosphohistidine phosphatase SixA